MLSSATWMKVQIILFSINRRQSKRCDYIEEKHQNKLNAIIILKKPSAIVLRKTLIVLSLI